MSKLISVVIAFSVSLVAVDAARGASAGAATSAPSAPHRPTEGRAQGARPATTAGRACDPAQQPQPAGASKWLGPGGLALGAGLAALFLNNGWAGCSRPVDDRTHLRRTGVAARALLRGRVAQQPLQYAGAAADGPSYPALPGGVARIRCGHHQSLAAGSMQPSRAARQAKLRALAGSS